MLKPKHQYFGYLMQRTDSLEKTLLVGKDLMLGKIEWKERREQQRMRWLDGITEWTWVCANSRRWWTGKPGVLHAVHGVEKSQTQLSDWTTIKDSNQQRVNLQIIQTAMQLNIKITNKPIKKRAEDVNRHFSKEDIQMVKKHMKDAQYQ